MVKKSGGPRGLGTGVTRLFRANGAAKAQVGGGAPADPVGRPRFGS
jgi:hypothetical protein